MTPTGSRSLAPTQSTRRLEEALPRFRGDLTVADAAAKSGLPLRDAEAALLALASACRGHLRATSEGELVFSFPRGFERTNTDRALARVARKVGRALLGVGRFVVRAWVSVVLVGYALVFLGLLLAWALKSDDDGGVGDVVAVVFRVLLEALFWTFHPFSPLALSREPAWARPRLRSSRGGKLPFYARVNQFVFGPPAPLVDPSHIERDVLSEIRRLAGRVGPMDVARITGDSREAAEARLLRLVVDHDGEVEATEEGAVVYKFPALRKTAEALTARAPAAPPVWRRPAAEVPPLTGNDGGTNALLGAINALNLVASGAIVAQGGANAVTGLGPELWWGLGVVPFAFSTALFALPLARAVLRGRTRRRVAQENGRRALLAALLSGGAVDVLGAATLAEAWRRGSGVAIDEATLTAEVQALGGEPDVDEAGRLVFRFETQQREAAALAAERRAASPAERALGEIVFASDDE